MSRVSITSILIFLSVLVIGIICVFPVGLAEFQSKVLNILAWVEVSRWTGLLVLSLLLTVFVVLMLPSVLLTVGSGFLFGTWAGALLIVLFETIGALMAFAVARFGAPKKLKDYLITSRYYSMLDAAVSRGGWRVVAATRMIPFFPFKISNYVYGVSGVSTKNYVLGTFIGLWPISIFNAYVGTLAADIATIGTAQAPSLQRWLISGLVLISLGLVIWLITIRQKAVFLKWFRKN